MKTLITQQGMPAVEFPIAPPPPRYPVVAKWDAGRIVLHEDRYEPWAIDDIVNVAGAIWLVTDEGRKRGGRNITAEYDAKIERALTDLEETMHDASPAGQS